MSHLPAPKDNFFFKSLYWLRIKWGLDRELKYLRGKILQRYLCLYFFTASYFPLMGSHTQDLILMHAPPGVSTPRYMENFMENYRQRDYILLLIWGKHTGWKFSSLLWLLCTLKQWFRLVQTKHCPWRTSAWLFHKLHSCTGYRKAQWDSHLSK